jgi:hypothetical protein
MPGYGEPAGTRQTLPDAALDGWCSDGVDDEVDEAPSRPRERERLGPPRARLDELLS